MKLATLSTEFFSNYQPPGEFWPRWSRHFGWSANYVPLYQWENVLFIGVCNWGPHPEIPVAADGTKMILLLAPADSLSRFFANLQAGASPSSDHEALPVELSEALVVDVVADSAPIQLGEEASSAPLIGDQAILAPIQPGSAPEDLVLLHDDAGDAQGGETKSNELSQLHESETSEEKPEGLTMNPAIVRLAPVSPNNNSSNPIATAAAAGAVGGAANFEVPHAAPSVAQAETAATVHPTESAFAAAPALESKTLANSEPDLKPAKPLPEPVSAKPTLPTKPPGRFGLPTKSSSPPPFTAPAKIAPAKPAVAPAAPTSGQAKPNSATALAHPVPPRTSPSPIAATAVAPAPATAPTSVTPVAPVAPVAQSARVSSIAPRSNDVHFNKPSDIVKQKVMDPLLPYYSKVMILLKNDTELNPWAWNNEFIPSTPEPHPVNLQKPSPFRIVEQTHKSYHGYVVDGEVQEAFFDNWNNSEVPDILTISPVIMQDTMVAAILGIGDKNINQKTSLQSCERAAEQLKLHLAEMNTAIKTAG